MNFLDYASKISHKVDELVLTIVSGEPLKLYEAALHYIKAGGKRLRPLVVVLASRISGGDENIALPGAAAVELLHTFTLVHDDIIDKDEFRRGVPTVHKLWGTDMAIVAGDLLYAYAYKCLLYALRVGVPNERLLKATEYLTDATIAIAEGQALDMLLPVQQDVKIDDYIKMVSKKTAVLFAASAAIGATLANGNKDTVEKLWNIMMYAGIAFQIRDDILGLIGDEKILGKPIYSDLKEGKMTIPIIYTLNNVSEIEKKKIRSVLGNRAAALDELRHVVEIIRDTGAIEYADSVADEYAAKALDLLNMLRSKDSEALTMLEDVVKFMVKRYY